MKAGRAEIARAVDRPDPALRLLLLHGPDEAGSRALGARFEAALGDGYERIDLAPGDLKADPARLTDEAAATSMFGAAMLIRISGIADESADARSEEHTSELQSLMRISYAVFCLQKNTKQRQ